MSHNSVHLYAEQVRSDILCINLRPQAHIAKIALRLVIRVTYVKQNAIQPANLEFNAEGTPVSRDFDDVYFSNDNGLEETRYVFLGGNRLPERFSSHPRPLLIVAESGFGTGSISSPSGRRLTFLFAITRTLPCKGYISSVLRNIR